MLYFILIVLLWESSFAIIRCDQPPGNTSKLMKTTDQVNGRDRVFAEISSREYHVENPFEAIKLPGVSNSSGSNPSIVYLSIYVRSISSINSESMDYEVDLYLQQEWHDVRLANSTLTRAVNYNDRRVIHKMWKPDIIFTNSKDTTFQYVTVPNVLLRVEPNGNVLYILRLKVKFDCMMDFFKYPMDKQICSMELSTFAKTHDELQLRWISDAPIRMYEKLKMSQFRVSSVKTYHCNITHYFGQYSCLRAEFYLVRELSYHLVQSYFSTSLIVVISWLSFWLKIDAIAARVTLGVTTLLTISSKGVGIENKLPPVTYLKAIDVWIFGCTTFVFAALLEFSVANNVWRFECRQDEQFHQFDRDRMEALMLSGQAEVPVSEKSEKLICSESMVAVSVAENIDRRSRVLFPVLFLMFAFFYWLYYCCWI